MDKTIDPEPVDIYAKTSVFDLIHSQQINSESSQLEKENSQFIIADITIAATEFMRTQWMDEEPLTRTMPSSEIQIIEKIFNTQDQDSSFNSMSPMSFHNEFITSIDHDIFISSGYASPTPVNNNFVDEIKSLSNISLDLDQTLPKSSSSANINDEQRVKAPKLIRQTQILSAETLQASTSFTSLPSALELNGSLFINSVETSLYNKKDQTYAGFDIINKDPIKSRDEDMRSVSSRCRRFSWEEISDFGSAEHISTRIIQNLINKQNNRVLKLPSLRELEIYIQSLEPQEYLQIYHELKGSGLLDSSKRQDSVNNRKSFKLPEISKVIGLSMMKVVAVAAATAVVQAQLINTNSPKSDQEKTKTLIKQISLNVLGSLINKESETDKKLSKKSIPINKVESFINESVNSSLISSYKSINARLIGDESWAPVRDQLILNLTQKPKRVDQMQLQDLRCAECGIQVKKDKIKTFNYCEYFCKYFCRCCHENSQSYIPAKIIYQSDYKTTYEVCKKAKNFLEKIYIEPVITLESLNPSLFEGSAVFMKMKSLRLTLTNCRSYINTCRFAAHLKTNLYQKFDDFIVDDQHIYSIDTLFKLRQTNYLQHFQAVVIEIVDHIKKCELCSQLGYNCGICGSRDLIYPFESDKVDKCPNCLACYHRKCFKTPDQCPRCKRKRNRVQ